MIRVLFIITITLFYSGCQKKKSFEEQTIRVFEERNFLDTVVVNGVSYRDDNLTPDVSDGKLFGERNITKETPSHYFIFKENRTLDHMATRYMSLNPNLILEEENYIDRDERIRQIMSFRELPKLRPPPKKREVVKKVEEDLNLPEGLLPPKIPRIPLHIDVPDFPGF